MTNTLTVRKTAGGNIQLYMQRDNSVALGMIFTPQMAMELRDGLENVAMNVVGACHISDKGRQPVEPKEIENGSGSADQPNNQ